MRIVRFAWKAICWIAFLLLVVWVASAARYAPLFPEWLQPWMCALPCVAFLVGFLRPKRIRRVARGVLAVCIVVVLGLWLSLTPSNSRDWLKDVSATPWAEVRGNLVTVHNVRNFTYRSETDFDVNYETRNYDIDKLTGVDFAVAYWEGNNIGHVMVSFSFSDEDFLAFSVETRKAVGQSYSTVRVFFRNYELAYIAADERDLFGVRTSYRNPEERVHILRTRMPLVNVRRLFLQYLKDINDLRERPRFYNTLMTNCTTQILRNAQAYSTKAKYNWQILLSGHVPALLYEGGRLASDVSLDELMSRGLINERSKKAGQSPEYSKNIREGIPKPELLPDSEA